MRAFSCLQNFLYPLELTHVYPVDIFYLKQSLTRDCRGPHRPTPQADARTWQRSRSHDLQADSLRWGASPKVCSVKHQKRESAALSAADC